MGTLQRFEELEIRKSLEDYDLNGRIHTTGGRP